ncbi:hypothetical protein V9T40_004742 [Parthenolecanium corni]|uniref:DEP domain-containing protein n=1 Tax=Parthenolecanium corni TaxID=536013 RepID=A0AAN9TEM6_9HEMI
MSKVDDDNGALDNLNLALIQCFAVIICGYVAGRTHLIMQRETSGLNTFVGKFSLPSLIFLSLCKLDLSAVNWMFIFAIFVSKTAIFFLVLIITILVTRPTNTARAGLLAIFCTQTNDFAIGVPIVDALYGSKHPDFVAYLYLLAPISLTILNPFGFVMMEIGKPRSTPNGSESSHWQMFRSIIRNIITNPIVFMTALGIVGNIAFSHKPPVVLDSILSVFGTAFTGTALMLLGLRMVGRVRTLQGTALLIPSLLIITKLLLTPLLMREIVALFLKDTNKPEVIQDLTTFSFLYGTIPSAPGVFVYATAYALDIDLIAASMVACTFLSAPLMFISAKMILASTLDPDRTKRLLITYNFNISILSIVGGIIVYCVFTSQKKCRFPHRITFFLVFTQILGCLGSVLCYYKVSYWPSLIEITSDMCSTLYTASLVIALLFIHARADQMLKNLQPALLILPLVIPLCLTMILIFINQAPVSCGGFPQPKETFEKVSTGLSISVLMFSLIVTVVCLVLAERNRRQNVRYSSLVDDDFPPSISGCVIPNSSVDQSDKCDNPFDPPIGDLGPVSSYQPNYLRHDSFNNAADEMQLLRHFVLLVFIACSFIVSLALQMWELVSDTQGGLYVEMSFIEITLKRGQALFAFCVFALDYRNVIKPFIKWLVKMWFGGEPVALPKWDALPYETRDICDQFVRQHLQKCKVDIEKTKWSLLFYGACFSGSSLVTWLIQNGVVRDNEEAGAYATKLLYGRVIRHIYNTEFFYNNPSVLYTFIADN